MAQVENVQSVGRDRLVIHSEGLFGGCGNGENAQQAQTGRNSTLQLALLFLLCGQFGFVARSGEMGLLTVPRSLTPVIGWAFSVRFLRTSSLQTKFERFSVFINAILWC
jgi:hypothetical protein